VFCRMATPLKRGFFEKKEITFKNHGKRGGGV
jgi:hypothetical protein